MGSNQLGSKFLKRSQICSHTPSALNAGAKRSGATCHYGHASMLLLGEGSEATEPYNKYDKIRPHSIRSQQFDQKVRPLSFRPEKFDLFTATLWELVFATVRASQRVYTVYDQGFQLIDTTNNCNRWLLN